MTELSHRQTPPRNLGYTYRGGKKLSLLTTQSTTACIGSLLPASCCRRWWSETGPLQVRVQKFTHLSRRASLPAVL